MTWHGLVAFFHVVSGLGCHAHDLSLALFRESTLALRLLVVLVPSLGIVKEVHFLLVLLLVILLFGVLFLFCLRHLLLTLAIW